MKFSFLCVGIVISLVWFLFSYVIIFLVTNAMNGDDEPGITVSMALSSIVIGVLVTWVFVQIGII